MTVLRWLRRSVCVTLCSMFLLAACHEDKQALVAVQTQRSLMRKIYEEDQKDRNDIEGDAKRREQVNQLMRDGKIQSAEDFYYAAFIFQHGQKPADYLYAHSLAVTAVSKGLHEAMWLSAATLDRYLWSIRQPQIFGTQFGGDQEPYDRKMISDDIRRMWCVAPETTQDQIQSDLSAGKPFRSTRTCPLPDERFDVN